MEFHFSKHGVLLIIHVIDLCCCTTMQSTGYTFICLIYVNCIQVHVLDINLMLGRITRNHGKCLKANALCLFFVINTSNRHTSAAWYWFYKTLYRVYNQSHLLRWRTFIQTYHPPSARSVLAQLHSKWPESSTVYTLLNCAVYTSSD